MDRRAAVASLGSRARSVNRRSAGNTPCSSPTRPPPAPAEIACPHLSVGPIALIAKRRKRARLFTSLATRHRNAGLCSGLFTSVARTDVVAPKPGATTSDVLRREPSQSEPRGEKHGAD